MDHSEAVPDDFLIRDPLTGAYTRGLLHARLTEELARAEREISPLVVCHFDLDHFAGFNQQAGSAAGDQILKDTALWTYQSIRTSDLLFRAGSDDFVLVLPSTTREQASVVCQRILDRFLTCPVSISMGVASYPEDGDSTEQLLQTAQKRLLLAQQEGGNQFITHEAGEQPRVYFNRLLRPLERAAQLSALEAFLHDLRTHHQGLFTVAGEQGSGRTFFLRQAALLAQQHQFVVLPLQHPAQDQQTFAEAQILQTLLDEVEQSGKAGLLVLYDGQDPLPASLIQQVFQAHDTTRPLGVVAVSGTEQEVQVPLVQNTSLPPLSQSALQQWIKDIFHWEAPEPFIQDILHHSGGLPGRAVQHLQTLLEQGKLKYQGGSWTVL
ncbi:GGDEF domain-containing protein [Deinococcus misasensis]|uniref:GGDEF domain-containing protein n=1 Tax=Deinococcus misasensis TaxID=392413 RepID=UPI000550DD18|nr:diguanylate cyclase [Deinococcus misasensis]